MKRTGLNWMNILLVIAAVMGVIVAIYNLLMFRAWGLGFLSIPITDIILIFVNRKREEK